MPKQLDSAPELFSPGGRGVPVVAELNPGRAPGRDGLPAGGQGVLITSQGARRRELADLLDQVPPDPEVASMATAISTRLSVRRRRRRARVRAGTGAVGSMPYRYRSDDIDLDRTIEVVTERPYPEDTDIVVRERTSDPLAAVLLVDVSGSMRGEKVRIAAATVAALAADLSDAQDQFGLVAFWSDAAVLKPLEYPVAGPAASRSLLTTLLRIPARGLTNVSFGLSVAHAEIARTAIRRSTAILLTDAVHNAGPDPCEIARRYSELHVLLETDGEHDLPLAREIASLGGGTLHRIRTHRDVAPALNRILDR